MWKPAHRRDRRTTGGRRSAGLGLALAVAACTSAPANPSPVSRAPVEATPSTTATPAAIGSGAPSSDRVIGHVAANIAMASPRDVTAAFGSIWVSNGPAATVTRLDPATAAIQAVVDIPAPASVLASGYGALFVTSYPGNSLTRIDPVTNRATKTISLASVGGGPVGVLVAHGSVWVADHDGTPVTSIAKVDPESMKILDVIPIGGGSDAGPQWVASAAGSIWTDVASIHSVVRIDPSSDTVQASIPLVGGCGAEMVGSDDAVWVANGGGDGCAPAVYRIDPHTNTVAQTIAIDSETGTLVLGPDGLWFGSSPGAMGRIDPISGSVTGRMDIPGAPFGAAFGGGAVWISDRDDERVFKIEPS